MVYIGVDHEHARFGPAPTRPATGERLEDGGFVLCLGVDFLHKNRHFALRTVAEMLREKGWNGQLVFAGPHASPGSSGGEERRYLDANPDVAGVTVDLGTVSEGEKRWLLQNASLVMAPSVYEGFGLIPFEAAAAGVPCLFAAQASLAEVLPEEVALMWRTAPLRMPFMDPLAIGIKTARPPCTGGPIRSKPSCSYSDSRSWTPEMNRCVAPTSWA